MLLLELLGTYALPPEATLPISWGGVWPDDIERREVTQVAYRCEPVVTLKELQAMAASTKSNTHSVFRQAVKLAAAGSASPGESVMYGVLSAPMRYGGFGLGLLPGGMLLNHRIDFEGGALHMASGVPYAVCDAYIPAAKSDIEYNGIGHEQTASRIHDGQRNNGLKGMGITVLVLNRDQMRDIVALEALAQSIYRAAGVQFRYRIKGVRLLQADWLNGLRRGIGLAPV